MATNKNTPKAAPEPKEEVTAQAEEKTPVPAAPRKPFKLTTNHIL